MATKADTIFYGGDVLTMDEDVSNPGISRTVEAVAVADGMILEVGSREDVFRHASDETQMICLDGQVLMPGFIEPHQHACLNAQLKSLYTDIGGLNYRTHAEIDDVIKARLEKLEPGEWGRFYGWDPELIPDLPQLTAEYLDMHYSSTIPIIIVGQSLHVCWLNSAALEASNITSNTPNPRGGTIVKDDASIPTGQLLETAVIMVYNKNPKPDLESLLKVFKDQWRYYASVGLTTVTELSFMQPDLYRLLLSHLARQPDCPIRLAVYRLKQAGKSEDFQTLRSSQREFFSHKALQSLPSTPEKEMLLTSNSEKDERLLEDRLWVAGIKLVADGSPHCGSAAVSEPYLDNSLTRILGFPKPPNYGKLNWETNNVIDALKVYSRCGLQVAIHCHGERACDQVLTAFEEVNGDQKIDVHRHRMEHCGLITKEQIIRAVKSAVTISFFVDHLRFYPSSYKTKILGERVNRWAPLSEATKAGVTWTIHQDHPAFPGDASPFSNMKTAVTRCSRDDPTTPYGPEYRVSIHEALKAYTINAAWQLHRDHDLGSITPGKKADFVVLSKNPYQVDPFDLEGIEVVETFLEGRSNGFATVKSVQGKNFCVLERGLKTVV